MIFAPKSRRVLLAGMQENREIALIAAIERAADAIADLTKAIDMAQPGSFLVKWHARNPEFAGAREKARGDCDRSKSEPDPAIVSPTNVTHREGL
jgi:hypothetical protein